MAKAGMAVARLNFSHGRLSEHQRLIELIRELNRKHHFRIKIMGDLEGYRIRVGELVRPLSLKKGEIVRIPFDYRGPLGKIKKGSPVYIDDGNIVLAAEAVTEGWIKGKVVYPGILKARKGINFPALKPNFSGLTAKDKEDAEFCLANRLDYVAQSFVRSAADIIALKDFLGRRGSSLKYIAKIENQDGIKNIDRIIKVTDGIMVARGDMGVALPIYEVPIMQKRIIAKCNRAGKFVITATQMLESMVENHLPTRAEVSDVANAILDGSDYVMLSAESAVGAYPIDCVKMMEQIIDFTWRNSGRGREKYSWQK